MKFILGTFVFLATQTVLAAPAPACRPGLKDLSDEVLVAMAQGRKLGDCDAITDGFGGFYVRINKTIVAHGPHSGLDLATTASTLRDLASNGACD